MKRTPCADLSGHQDHLNDDVTVLILRPRGEHVILIGRVMAQKSAHFCSFFFLSSFPPSPSLPPSLLDILDQMSDHKKARGSVTQVTCTAPVNIAVIKYWGKRDVALNLPCNSSLSYVLFSSSSSSSLSLSLLPSSFNLYSLFLFAVSSHSTLISFHSVAPWARTTCGPRRPLQRQWTLRVTDCG
jgi:hypothetical protein